MYITCLFFHDHVAVRKTKVRDFLRLQFGPELEFVNLDVAPELLTRRIIGRVEKQAADAGKSLEEYVMENDQLFPPHAKTLDERMEMMQQIPPPVEAIDSAEQRTVNIPETPEMDASAVLAEVQQGLGL